MSSLDSLLPSRLLKKEDERLPMTLTIKGTEKGSFKNDDGGEEPAAFINFEEIDQQVPIKAWTVDNLKEIFGDNATTQSIVGGTVEAYFDPTVKFGTKRVGGLRLRKPSGAAASPF